MMTKISMIDLIFNSTSRNLYYRPKEVQEWIKNLNTEETNLNSICAILTTDYHFMYTTPSVLR